MAAMISPTEYLRLVLDPVRLGVIGAAAGEPVVASDLAGRLGVPERRVLGAIADLRTAGLLDERFRLDREALVAVARQLPGIEPAADEVLTGEWTTEEAEILRRFFSGPRLTEIPSARSKRIVVLERLAQEFEPGLRYTEREVSATLQAFHPDYAALRRYLVDEGLLTRAAGVYWRSGGRFEDGLGAAEPAQ